MGIYNWNTFSIFTLHYILHIYISTSIIDNRYIYSILFVLILQDLKERSLKGILAHFQETLQDVRFTTAILLSFPIKSKPQGGGVHRRLLDKGFKGYSCK